GGGTGGGKGGSADGSDKTDDKTEEGGKCKYLPDWLCGDSVQPSEVDWSSMSSAIKKHDSGIEYQKEDILSSGVCPKPLTASLSGLTLTLPFDFVCGFLEQIRAVVVAIFLLVSAFVIMKGFE
ncbi:hypothetical protein EGK74_13640, partial [Neisseria weixii]